MKYYDLLCQFCKLGVLLPGPVRLLFWLHLMRLLQLEQLQQSVQLIEHLWARRLLHLRLEQLGLCLEAELQHVSKQYLP